MPPVIAVAAAVGSVGAGMSALAAGSSLLGGMMIAGGVASGLGALTGNKTLSMLGGVVGLAGGVAGMMSGAWDSTASALASESAFGDQAATAGNYINSADAASDAVTSATGYGGDSVASSMSNAGASDPASSMSDTSNSLAAPPPPGRSSALPESTRPMSSEAQASQQMATAPPQTNNPSDLNYRNAVDTQSDTATANSGVVAGAAKPGSWWDTVKSVPQWIEKNKELAKIGGGLVGGAMKSYGDQSLLRQRFELQDEYEQRQRQRYSDSITGLRMPVYQPPTR